MGKVLMTIGEYAKRLGFTRDAIHKRINDSGTQNLPAVTKIQKTVDGVNILTVDQTKLNNAK